ncbi:MAG: glycoside hydrolase family 2 protein [Clostridia bacterium]|nr:glycoside hydrolase family 2 protein [Clostridia bacterium]
MERSTKRLAYDWRFRLYPEGEVPEGVYAPAYDDTDWECVRVPHDWAASGEFDEHNDCSYSAIAQDGIDRPIEHSGRTGALPIVGLGVYRLALDIPAEDCGQKLFLQFDGVMWDSDIYVNGKHVFFNHFGYKSFCVDISDAVEYGKPNLIAVAARVYHDCSRWYPGAGIYRNVYLVKKAPVHIEYNGVWLRQLEIAENYAKFLLSVEYAGPETVSFRADILDPDGNVVLQAQHGTYLGELSDILVIPDVKLWDLDTPNLYTANVFLLDEEGNVCDNVSVKFGARKIAFTPEGGFFLNGRQQKMNGVCNHHDLGSLGAAVNEAALRRQLRLMREMGVNAIRTSHNPPSPELLDLCDELGFVVMDEFFDEWYIPKVTSGYAKYYRDHAAQDVIDVIRRDRNHPSVVMWSIGNEINEQHDKEGWRAAMMLTETVHRTDPTRPTTAGFDRGWACFDNHLANFVDVVGLNYKPHLYAEVHRKHPDMVLVGTETASCVSSRGIYHFPAEMRIPMQMEDDLTVSAYEMGAPGWAYYAEREFAAQDDYPFVAGEFVWTGMDYLGEPTPYYNKWPSRSSYFGVVDLAGLPKNRFYGYKAHWTDEDVLHVFPHWNWEGKEGQIVPVHVYTSWPMAELFVNGVSQGKRVFTRVGNIADSAPGKDIPRYRLMWDDVVYQPGEIRVVAYDADGRAAAEQIVKTAGAPDHIVLTADRDAIAADGDDLVYVTAAIVDKEGVVCPLADNRLTFTAEGAGELLTTDAGDQRETESFARADKKAFTGYLVGCFRSVQGQTGTLTVSVSGEGLTGADMDIVVL